MRSSRRSSEILKAHREAMHGQLEKRRDRIDQIRLHQVQSRLRKDPPAEKVPVQIETRRQEMPQNYICQITEQLVQEKSGGLHFLQIKTLNLHIKEYDAGKIRHIENLERLKNLQELNLSYNIITKIENLSCLTKLKELNLAENNINKIEGLQDLESLERLNLSGNCISHIPLEISKNENLQDLRLARNKLTDLRETLNLSSLKKLAALSLKGNPLADPAHYRLYVIAQCEALVNLDSTIVSDQESTAAVRRFARAKGKVGQQLERRRASFSIDEGEALAGWQRREDKVVEGSGPPSRRVSRTFGHGSRRAEPPLPEYEEYAAGLRASRSPSPAGSDDGEEGRPPRYRFSEDTGSTGTFPSTKASGAVPGRLNLDRLPPPPPPPAQRARSASPAPDAAGERGPRGRRAPGAAPGSGGGGGGVSGGGGGGPRAAPRRRPRSASPSWDGGSGGGGPARSRGGSTVSALTFQPEPLAPLPARPLLAPGAAGAAAAAAAATRPALGAGAGAGGVVELDSSDSLLGVGRLSPGPRSPAGPGPRKPPQQRQLHIETGERRRQGSKKTVGLDSVGQREKMLPDDMVSSSSSLQESVEASLKRGQSLHGGKYSPLHAIIEKQLNAAAQQNQQQIMRRARSLPDDVESIDEAGSQNSRPLTVADMPLHGQWGALGVPHQSQQHGETAQRVQDSRRAGWETTSLKPSTRSDPEKTVLSGSMPRPKTDPQPPKETDREEHNAFPVGEVSEIIRSPSLSALHAKEVQRIHELEAKLAAEQQAAAQERERVKELEAELGSEQAENSRQRKRINELLAQVAELKAVLYSDTPQKPTGHPKQEKGAAAAEAPNPTILKEDYEAALAAGGAAAAAARALRGRLAAAAAARARADAAHLEREAALAGELVRLRGQVAEFEGQNEALLLQTLTAFGEDGGAAAGAAGGGAGEGGGGGGGGGLRARLKELEEQNARLREEVDCLRQGAEGGVPTAVRVEVGRQRAGGGEGGAGGPAAAAGAGAGAGGEGGSDAAARSLVAMAKAARENELEHPDIAREIYVLMSSVINEELQLALRYTEALNGKATNSVLEKLDAGSLLETSVRISSRAVDRLAQMFLKHCQVPGPNRDHEAIFSLVSTVQKEILQREQTVRELKTLHMTSVGGQDNVKNNHSVPPEVEVSAAHEPGYNDANDRVLIGESEHILLRQLQDECRLALQQADVAAKKLREIESERATAENAQKEAEETALRPP